MFHIGDEVTLKDPANFCALLDKYRTAVIICKFPESDNYLLDHNLYGYEYWQGRFLEHIDKEVSNEKR